MAKNVIFAATGLKYKFIGNEKSVYQDYGVILWDNHNIAYPEITFIRNFGVTLVCKTQFSRRPFVLRIKLTLGDVDSDHGYFTAM